MVHEADSSALLLTTEYKASSKGGSTSGMNVALWTGFLQRWPVLQGADVSAVTMIALGNGVAQYKLQM